MSVTANNQTFDTWASAMQLRIEAVLDQHMPTDKIIPARLHEAMRYATLNGGKRVRAPYERLYHVAFESDGFEVDAAAAAVDLITHRSRSVEQLVCDAGYQVLRGVHAHVRIPPLPVDAALDGVTDLEAVVGPDDVLNGVSAADVRHFRGGGIGTQAAAIRLLAAS